MVLVKVVKAIGGWSSFFVAETVKEEFSVKNVKMFCIVWTYQKGIIFTDIYQITNMIFKREGNDNKINTIFCLFWLLWYVCRLYLSTITVVLIKHCFQPLIAVISATKLSYENFNCIYFKCSYLIYVEFALYLCTTEQLNKQHKYSQK